MVYVRTLGFVGWGGGERDAQICLDHCSSLQLCQGGWGCFGMIVNEGTLDLKGNPPNGISKQTSTDLCALGSEFVVAKKGTSVISWGWDPVSKQ